MSARRTKKRCKASGKIKWHTKLDAELALAEIWLKDNRSPDEIECRSYPCPDCGMWHLTKTRRGRRRKTV